MTRLHLGSVEIAHDTDYTVTTFPDGKFTVADHAEQPGQAETAAKLGMSVAEMNVSHDLTHSLLAYMLGLPESPTLYGVAINQPSPLWEIEEEAVLAIQRFAKAAGVDLVAAARRLGGE